ncbi:MAG: AI-2E family transporter [Myxococcota bacterium]|nr:AI-2E family transporter [Myxococcota bacterium]
MITGDFTPPPQQESKSERLSRRVTQHLSAQRRSLCAFGFLLVQLKPILVPLVLAVLLALLLSPLIQKMTQAGISGGVALLIAELCAFLPLVGVTLTLSMTTEPLSQALPKYKAAILTKVNDLVQWVGGFIENPELRDSLRREMQDSLLPQLVDQGVLLFQQGLKATSAGLGLFFLTLLLSAFVLLEASHLKEKMRAAYGASHPLLVSISSIGEDVRAYVVAKTLINLLTGGAVWLILTLSGVDFALFWGLIAFPLNFIPTVGAIIASFPPLVIALVDPELSWPAVLFVIFGLGAVNGVIGSFLDPRYVGQKVRLSPLVILTSMLLWALLWGPIGALLAVPLMASLRVVFSHVPTFKPFAIMMRG